MSQSSKLNRLLTQAFGMFFGIALAVWILRGIGIEILAAIPGGVIWLLFGLAIAMGILAYVQKTWWRF
ncbi:MAG: hypothetical protein IGS39_14380 [Calothrix sp. C42_A2020_038]|nr:hypothetical protein [Calothrix sp. C42_A2020_038]